MLKIKPTNLDPEEGDKSSGVTAWRAAALTCLEGFSEPVFVILTSDPTTGQAVKGLLSIVVVKLTALAAFW